MTTLDTPLTNAAFWTHMCERMAKRTWTNACGNTVWTVFMQHASRYTFDFTHCTCLDGWRQFDTKQDASYFGIWIHDARRHIVTYAEGDLTVVECADAEGFRRELEALHAYHGAPPPMAIVYDEDGQVTEIYDERSRQLPE